MREGKNHSEISICDRSGRATTVVKTGAHNAETEYKLTVARCMSHRRPLCRWWRRQDGGSSTARMKRDVKYIPRDGGLLG